MYSDSFLSVNFDATANEKEKKLCLKLFHENFPVPLNIFSAFLNNGRQCYAQKTL